MLELHVWGPAFGLPSIDAECLATIVYFTQTINQSEYQLIQSSPSAVPTHHLPALHNPSQNTWISGFSAISSHLRPQFSSASQSNHKAESDSTAYTTFITAHAPPLLSLSLYVSSANWSTTTRPAYSKILPFPLPWTEPPAIRAAMSARASHLGMSSLDTDAEAEKAEAAAKADSGWVHVPESIKKSLKQKRANNIRDSLSPEERSRIRLEGLAADVLDVVGEVLTDWDEDQKTTLELRCLAFGYLALMLMPDVPRPWLKEVMVRKYSGLCEFVEGFRARCGLLEDDSSRELPWSIRSGTESSLNPSSENNNTLMRVATRFTQGVIRDIPLVGEEWARWWAHRRAESVRILSPDSKQDAMVLCRNKDLILLTGGGLTLVAAAAGLFYLYKGLLPFGARVQTWRAPVALGLSGLGAAGAMFSGLALD